MPSQPGWLRIIVFFCCFAFQIELVYLWLYVSAYKPLATAKSPKFQDLYWSWVPPPSHVPPVPISMNLLSEGNVLNEWKNEEIKCLLWVGSSSGPRVLFRQMEIKFRAECGLCISLTQALILSQWKVLLRQMEWNARPQFPSIYLCTASQWPYTYVVNIKISSKLHKMEPLSSYLCTAQQ